METSKFTFNQKVTPSAVKVMLTMFLDSQGVLLAYFQKRDENVNSTLYCEVLLKLQDAIHRKRPGVLARWVLLHHDNARPHTARATQERTQELQWELLAHLPYSPDLAPSDFHLFGPLKNHLGGRRFTDDDVETEAFKVAETTVKRLQCCKFQYTGKASRQVYQCWWRICREINVSSWFECHMFYVLYPFVTYLLTLPRIINCNLFFILVGCKTFS
jgi:histone-lysine N-methyltransferase SETMAR